MTDEKLNELEAICREEVDEDGNVKLDAGDVLEAVNELRELRSHAADLSAHEGAIAKVHRLLTSLSAYADDSPVSAGIAVSGRIPVQDPGR